GEEVFVKLISSIESGNPHPAIEGIVFYRDGLFQNDSKIAILDNLDDLPIITFDLVEQGTTFSPKIVSSRGCPFHCSFCSISAFYGGKYRQRSVSDVIADIENYIEWGYDSFWFHDDNLTVDGAWVREFCNTLLERKIKISWNCMSRIDTIVNDPDLIKLMAKCGCKLLAIGIESGIPEVLEKMHKKIDPEKINRAIDILNRIKISHNWYMILGSGDEFDTPEYIEKNIKFFQSHRFGYVLISILTPFPGTELYHKLASEGRILHKDYEKYDIVHCVYQPLGMTPSQMESYLPKAYLKVYLAKGWRLLPLFIGSIASGAIRFSMISGALKAMFKTVFLKMNFNDALSKKR
ncbi:MAG: radical SAM protein, partial [Candidatus Cloacimonadaceae bacterium]|nr:radical SAM protein [Candidatus Cloacimonadaceae bacterium]